MWGSPGVCAGVYTVFAVCVPLGDIVRAHGLAYHFYAHDSRLYCSFKPETRPPVLAIESCLNDIDAWMLTNMLKLNKEKTELLVIILALKLSISALTQSCDALEKSQILSRRNIIQFLKPHNNPNDETTKLDKKNKEITDLIEEKHTELMTASNVGA